MLVAIGALLGVPVWILLGWLAGGVWHRHQTKQLPGVFKTKVRLVSGTQGHVGDDFPHTAGHALWAHDILILEKGLLIPRTVHFTVEDGVQPAQPADPEKVKGLGDSPVTLQCRLDTGAIIEVAVPGDVSEEAKGPFFSDTTNEYAQ